MGDYGLTQEELEICTVEFNNCLASIDDEKERTWMTYEECKLALMKILEREFIWDYVFYKVLSEIRDDGSKNEDDTKAAFEALGGDPEDPDSFINSTQLVDILMKDFKMTIDIEKMLEEIDEEQNSAGNSENTVEKEFFQSFGEQ